MNSSFGQILNQILVLILTLVLMIIGVIFKDQINHFQFLAMMLLLAVATYLAVINRKYLSNIEYLVKENKSKILGAIEGYNAPDDSWHVFWSDVQHLVEMIKKDNTFHPKVVVSVGRGGAVVGAMLAGNLGELPHYGIDRLNKYISGERVLEIIPHSMVGLEEELEGKCVLLVMAECTAGKTLPAARAKLKNVAGEIKTAVLYRKKGAAYNPDYAVVREAGDVDLPFRSASWPRSSRGEKNNIQF